MKAGYGWVVLREQRLAGRLTRLLGLAVVQCGLHAFDTFYDFIRYLRFFTPLRARTRERRKLEALIVVHAHKIEKTLALPAPPRIFGTSYLGTLLHLLESWVRSVGDLDSITFRAACGALQAYRDRVGEQLHREFPELSARLDRQLAQYGTQQGGKHEGGTRRLTAHEFRAGVEAIDFGRLAELRHSVRSFAPDPVPDEMVARAVQIAQSTPSVCNRQAWRVHVYTSQQDKEMVLRTQDGNSGFGHLAARVLLISADTRVYVTSGERHQPWVDGGMFAMTLVFALQAEGIASCCLNLCNYFFQDVAVHRACQIPAWEVPIMMIAIGYPPAEFHVAVSARRETEAVLAWRAL